MPESSEPTPPRAAAIDPDLARPESTYSERLALRETALVEFQRRDSRFSQGRVACFIGFLILVVAGWQLAWSYWILLIPVVAFLALVVVHERVLEARDRALRAVEHYRDGLDRLAERWAGKGVLSTDFVSADHPFAADLDLFGSGSLFDRICRARTRAGEECLAQWLTIHADMRVEVEEIRARQRSVQALIEGVDLREDLAVLGAAARFEVRPNALIEWGRAPSLFPPSVLRWLPAVGIGLPLLAGAALIMWALGLGPYAFIVVAVIEGGIYRGLKATLTRVMGVVDKQGRELSVLAALLARVEHGEIDDPRLAQLRTQLGVDGSDQPASEAIAQLCRLAGWYEAQRNALFGVFAVLFMWGPNFALAIERWRGHHGPRIAGWIAALAEIEALSSLAGYAFENPDAVFPELVEDSEEGPVIAGKELGHPLLGRDACVRNDLSLEGPVRAHVISGSNMSGKSTFLRTVGTNVVLALAGGPVCASSMRVSPLRIGATLRVQDSLQEGASRFWAELVRLRTVSELAKLEPTLFLLDEIFHGTNSHDRRIGAEALLRSLLGRGAIGLLTTHDLALAEAAEALAPAATNVHFEDQLHEGELCFDYRMRPGVVRKSNALALMRSVGLEL